MDLLTGPPPYTAAPLTWISPLLTRDLSLLSTRKTLKKVKKIHFKEFEEFTRSVAIIQLWKGMGGREDPPPFGGGT